MRRRRDWKAITLDYVELSNFDDIDTIPVCLTQRQVAILKAMLIPAYWSTRWTSLSISKSDLKKEMAELDYKLDGMECNLVSLDDLKFRDNPSDPCQVQYSTDGGIIWQRMFRKDVCAPDHTTTIGDVTNLYQDIDTTINNNNTWNGDIVNVAPDWEYVDPDSDAALCWVIHKYVQLCCEAATAQIDSDNQTLRDQNNWLDDIAVLIAELVMDSTIVLLGAFTVPTLAAGAVAWASVQVVEAVWDWLITYGDADYSADYARNTVACFMYDQIRGETPQWGSWTASLDNFNYDTATDDEIAIARIVSEWNESTDIYINFMILFEDINSISAGLPGCDCPQLMIFDQLAGPTQLELYGTEFTQSTNLVIGNPGDTPHEYIAEYAPLNQFYNGVTGDNIGIGANIRVTLPPDVLVSKVTVGWGVSRPSVYGGGDKNAGMWLGDPTDDANYIGGYSWPGGEYGTITNERTIINEAGIHATPDEYLYVHNSMQTASGTAFIYWIHVECFEYVP